MQWHRRWNGVPSTWIFPVGFNSKLISFHLKSVCRTSLFIQTNLFSSNLTFLNLSSTDINTWDDIDRLAKFPALKNLRVQNWPLWEKCDATEHERRQLLIARLPFVQTLNGGGVIGGEEREDAERAFIRYYLDKPEADRPERYNELVAVHGKLDPLVNIDLRPEKRVKVTFTYGDVSEVRSVDVYRYANHDFVLFILRRAWVSSSQIMSSLKCLWLAPRSVSYTVIYFCIYYRWPSKFSIHSCIAMRDIDFVFIYDDILLVDAQYVG